MRQKNKGKVGQILQVINIVPLLVFGFISILLCYYCFTKTMYQEISQELYYVACNVDALLNTAYPGDYSLVGEKALSLYKGESDITRSYELLDAMKERSGLEISVFYQDTCILTTTYNAATGERYVGVGASETAISQVLEQGENLFASRAFINGKRYFAYYIPLQNADGHIVGMICVAKSGDEVDLAILQSLYPFIIATIAVIGVISIFLFIYNKRIAHILLYIRNFLSDVSSGNLTAELNPSVTRRTDEFGDIGRSVISMQSSLRNMVEQDALTGLSNRRAADRRLKQIIHKHETQGTPFSLAIADIDYFKKVNDTYGHDAGDLILKNVADKLREHMRTYGFVARWGGEEFLLVFDHSDVYTAHKALQDLSVDIRRMESGYEGIIIMVTMTFGLAAGNSTDINAIIREADEYLYEGKEAGRNRIVWDDPQKKTVGNNAANSVDSPEANITEVELEEEVISLEEADALLREKEPETDVTETTSPETDSHKTDSPEPNTPETNTLATIDGEKDKSILGTNEEQA